MSTQENTRYDNAVEKESNFSIISGSDVSDVFEVNEKKPSLQAFSHIVRIQSLKVRQGTVKVKGRSEVARTNKKPWRQKGTGRARAGSARSPLWRGGGIVFGPQMRKKAFCVSKKLNKNVLHGAIAWFLKNSRVVSLNWQLSDQSPSTAQAYKALQRADLVNAKFILFLSREDTASIFSFANIPYVQICSYDSPYLTDILVAEYLVILKKDMPLFKEMVSKCA